MKGARLRGAGFDIGIGSDLCEIERIETTLAPHGERFASRCFTETGGADGIDSPFSRLRIETIRRRRLHQSLGHWPEAGRVLARHGSSNLPSGQPA